MATPTAGVEIKRAGATASRTPTGVFRTQVHIHTYNYMLIRSIHARGHALG